MAAFKKNLHLAKRYRIEKVDALIKNYPKKFPTPKYLLFIKKMIEEGWEVKVYIARVSKYVFVIKEEKILKIRFSNHRPILEKENENDCDFYVGISNYTVHTTEQIIEKIKSWNTKE